MVPVSQYRLSIFPTIKSNVKLQYRNYNDLVCIALIAFKNVFYSDSYCRSLSLLTSNCICSINGLNITL